MFLWLAQFPWREVTWLGSGHSIPWYHEPSTFPLGGGNEAVLLLDDPSRLPGPDVPSLDGFRSSNEPVRWLWIVPINEREPPARQGAQFRQPDHSAGRAAPQLGLQPVGREPR